MLKWIKRACVVSNDDGDVDNDDDWYFSKPRTETRPKRTTELLR